MPLFLRTLPILCLAASFAASVSAQEAPAPVFVAAENVRLDYAKVLSVEPVYQTLRASRTEMRCEEVAPPVAPKAEEEGRWSRIAGSVKDLFTREPDPPPKPAEPIKPNCRMVPVQREFRRPIAYDVEYVYKGTKYRSRLAEDPGNRLRIRVSVMPYVTGEVVALP